MHRCRSYLSAQASFGIATFLLAVERVPCFTQTSCPAANRLWARQTRFARVVVVFPRREFREIGAAVRLATPGAADTLSPVAVAAGSVVFPSNTAMVCTG